MKKIRISSRINKIKRNKKGFTLLEVLVSIFIFSIIMVSVSQIFSSFISNFAKAKSMQRNMENAQYAINLVAKTLRTSTIVAYSPSTPESITVFDHSKGRCYAYSFGVIGGVNSLNQSTKTATSSSDCLTPGYSAATAVTSMPVKGAFIYAQPTGSADFKIGSITMKLEVGDDAKEKPIIMQTSVSLRDYAEAASSITPVYACDSGTLVANAVPCGGTGLNLREADPTNYSLVGTCSASQERKCESICDTGYVLNGGACVVPADVTPPSAPTGLVATAGVNVINLTWNANPAADGVTAYRIYNSVTASLIDTVTATSYAHNVTVGTYSYYVKAVDAASNESAQSNTASATMNSGTVTWTSGNNESGRSACLRNGYSGCVSAKNLSGTTVNCSSDYINGGTATCSGSTAYTTWTSTKNESGNSACARAGYSTCSATYNGNGTATSCTADYLKDGVAACSNSIIKTTWLSTKNESGNSACARAGYSTCSAAYDGNGTARVCSADYITDGVAICSNPITKTTWLGTENESGNSACARAGYSTCSAAYDENGTSRLCSTDYITGGVAICSDSVNYTTWLSTKNESGNSACTRAGYSTCSIAYDNNGTSKTCASSNVSGGVAICSGSTSFASWLSTKNESGDSACARAGYSTCNASYDYNGASKVCSTANLAGGVAACSNSTNYATWISSNSETGNSACVLFGYDSCVNSFDYNGVSRLCTYSSSGGVTTCSSTTVNHVSWTTSSTGTSRCAAAGYSSCSKAFNSSGTAISCGSSSTGGIAACN